MSDLSYANAKTQLNNQLMALIELYDFANANTPNLISLQNTQLSRAIGTYGRKVMADWWSRVRTPISRILEPSNVKALIHGPLLDIAAAAGLRSRDVDGILAEWAEYRHGFGGQAITGISKANPAVVTSAAHGLSNGNVVWIDGVGGMTEVNQALYTVANVATDTFQLSGIDSSSYTTYTSGGWWRQCETFNSRDLTYGSVTAHGKNVGTGTIRRLTVGKRNTDLENCHCEAKKAVCVSDQTSEGEKHREVFRVRGTKAEADYCQVTGSGLEAYIRCLTTRDSEEFISNPTFSSYTGTAPTAGSPDTCGSTTEITDWTLTTAANAQVQLDTTYRDLTGESNTYAVTFTDNNAISQTIIDTTRAKFLSDVPYYLQVAIYRASSCDGTLTIALGRNSKAYTMSTLSNGAWNICLLDLDQGLWAENFVQDDMALSITLASRTTGTLHIDDIVFGPMTRIDGTYYAAVGGPEATPFRLKDEFTWTDTDPGSDAGTMYWLWRTGTGVDFPSATSAGETDADPS